MTDPTRAILIAESMADGAAWLDGQPVPPSWVVVVTPRSRHAARGCVASMVFATPAASRHSRFSELLAASLPATASTRSTWKGRDDD
jgi:hypothetical protein